MGILISSQERKGQLTSLQLVGMARGVAHGMKYLSELNFIHRVSIYRDILFSSYRSLIMLKFTFTPVDLSIGTKKNVVVRPLFPAGFVVWNQLIFLEGRKTYNPVTETFMS